MSGLFNNVDFDMMLDTEQLDDSSVEKSNEESTENISENTNNETDDINDDEADLFDSDDEPKTDLEDSEEVDENEDDEEEEEEELDEESKEGQDEIEDNFLHSLNTVLKEGVFASSDFKISGKSPKEQVESLLTGLDSEVDARINSWAEGLDDRLKNIFQAYEKGVSTEDLESYYNKGLDLDKISVDKLDDVEVAEQLLIQDKVDRGLSLEDAKEEVDSMTDPVKHAKKAYERLNKRKESFLKEKEQEIEKQNKKIQQEHESIKNTFVQQIDTTEELIPGIKLNSVKKERLKKSIFTPVTYDKNNRPIGAVEQVKRKDPVKFEMILHHLVDITDGFTDWSNFTDGAKTSAIKELEESISNNKKKGRSTSIKKHSNNEVSASLASFFKSS